jgi:YggT family protein
MQCLVRLHPTRYGAPPISYQRLSMRALLEVILIALDIYVWLLIASAVLSWLIAFNVVNTRNQFVAMMADFLFRITEPALAPVRAILPNLGGIDISPVVVILIIIFIQKVIITYIHPNVI